jgi:hypothetical protein
MTPSYVRRAESAGVRSMPMTHQGEASPALVTAQNNCWTSVSSMLVRHDSYFLDEGGGPRVCGSKFAEPSMQQYFDIGGDTVATYRLTASSSATTRGGVCTAP